MANELPITVVGNLTDDPQLRFTPSGAAVVNFTVAQTPRKFDKNSNEFRDQETIFMRCSAWREMAENVAESLTKGSRVVATGFMEATSWEDKETGAKRTGFQLAVHEVGPSLKWASAQITKNAPQQGGGQQQGGQQQGGWGTPPGQQAPGWAGQGAPQQGGWGNPPQGAPQQGNSGPLTPPEQQGGWGGPPPPQQQGGWGGPDYQGQPEPGF